MLVLLAAIAWLFRRPLEWRDDPALVWECATVSLLTLLYSPITWGQHCVAAIPGFYLVIPSIASGRQLPRWTQWTLGVITFLVLFTNRSIIGRDLSLLLESNHLVTLSLVALLAVVFRCQLRSHE